MSSPSRRFVTFLDRRGWAMPRFGRFANALIETSFPTLGIYLLTLIFDAPIAFGSWVSQLYFLFIILSTLRLDFALSLFTGAVAAAELFALAYVKIGLDWRADDANSASAYHLTRSMVLLARRRFRRLCRRRRSSAISSARSARRARATA